MEIMGFSPLPFPNGGDAHMFHTLAQELFWRKRALVFNARSAVNTSVAQKRLMNLPYQAIGAEPSLPMGWIEFVFDPCLLRNPPQSRWNLRLANNRALLLLTMIPLRYLPAS